VNSKNSQYWSAENSEIIHEIPLHDEKAGVWCAMSAGCEFSTSCEELQGVNCVFRSCAQCIRSGGATFLTSSIALMSFCKTL
jgi:hypothetical protein